ncbi:MAG: hypothetical protein AAF845_15455 [Bacteroidota bacterium]
MRFALSLLLVLAALPASGQIVVVNQGEASVGDGSLTLIPEFPQSGTEAVHLFGGQLGSTLQSATEAGDDLYLVSSSADRIDIVDLDTDTRVGQIASGLSSPRYLALLNAFDPSKAYVSNHVAGGSSYVVAVDLSARTVGTAIEVDGLPETIAVQFLGGGRGKAYVALGASAANRDGVDSLAVLDAEADTLLRYVDIGCSARFVRETLGTEVVAFCEDTDEAVVIDAEADTVKQRLAFGEEIGDPFGVGQSVGPGSRPIAVRRPSSFEHYVITASGIAVVEPIDRDTYGIVRTIPIPEADTRSISAVALSPGGNLLVLGRPDSDNPFSADGTITIHNADDGALRATYPAGVYPSHIVLDEQHPLAETAGSEVGGFRLTLAGANPARHHTAVDLVLDRPASVRVDLFDGLGRRVQTVATGDHAAGTHRLRLGVEGLAPGTYVVRAVSDSRVTSRPLTVVR